jgi:hypothetical protein
MLMQPPRPLLLLQMAGQGQGQRCPLRTLTSAKELMFLLLKKDLRL